MRKNNINLIRIASTIFLLSLIQTSCATTPTPSPPTGDEVSNIQVTKTKADTTVSGPEEFPLTNCAGTDALSQTLGSQTSVRKSVSIGSRASTSVGGEVDISAVAKAKLEAAVELAYQQNYETAQSRLDQIVMKAGPGSHVVYKVYWEEQRFDSIVSYNIGIETYQAPYTFSIYAPKFRNEVTDTYRLSCPTDTADIPTATPTDTPVPTRMITIQGNAVVFEDDYWWAGDDETGNLLVMPDPILLSPTGSNNYTDELCVGDEVWFKLQINMYLREDLTAEMKISASLFEEDNCPNNDREDYIEDVLVTVPPDGVAVDFSRKLTNNEEGGGDWATINLTFTNNAP